jgi:DNA-binding beta-propeller fold protein YncE
VITTLKNIIVVGFSLLVVASMTVCGGGGGGGGSMPYNPLWVFIDHANLDTVVAADTVDLSGEAYCDNCPPSEAAFGYCPPIMPPQSSAVSVTWNNRTTGAAGAAVHAITGSCSCLFSYCFTSYSHKWAAYGAPLAAIGDNVIEVTASDGAGNVAADSVTFTRLPVTGLNRPGGIAVDPVNNEVFVASIYNSAIVVYARTDSGNATPQRIISGPSTGLSAPYGMALDPVNNEVFAVNGKGTITVYARTADGDAAPVRAISPVFTDQSYPGYVGVDTFNNEIFVTNRNNSGTVNSITVFPRTANGAAGPVRTISGASTGMSSPMGIAVDTIHDEILVASCFNSSIVVYARTDDGNAPPKRTISGTSTGLNCPRGIAVGTVNNEIFVTNIDNRITAYARTASGDATPVRTVSGASTGLYGPADVAVDTVNNEIFVTNIDNRITVYSRTANGDAAPLRTINGATAGL